MLIERNPELYEVMEELFESRNNVKLDHLARYVMYGIICAGESKLGLEYMVNRLESKLYKDEEEAGQLRAEIICAEELLGDVARQEERVRPGRRMGVKQEEKGETKEKSSSTNDKGPLAKMLREQGKNKPKSGEGIVDEAADNAAAKLLAKRNLVVERHDEIAEKHHARELWGHGHNPHRHRPHHHSPHHHSPHRHRPHRHDPHVHSPTGSTILFNAGDINGNARYNKGGLSTFQTDPFEVPRDVPGATQARALAHQRELLHASERRLRPRPTPTQSPRRSNSKPAAMI